MTPYELMFILDTSLPEDERRDIANEVERELIDLGLEVNNSEKFDERELAYDINGVSRGEYRLIEYEAEPSENINDDIRERLNFRDDVIRYLIVNREEYENRQESPFEESESASTEGDESESEEEIDEEPEESAEEESESAESEEPEDSDAEEEEEGEEEEATAETG